MSTGPGARSFDLARLSTASKIAGGAAVVLLISTFLEWLHVSFAGIAGGGASGFSAYSFGKLTALAAAIVIALVVMEAMAVSVSLPLAPALIIVICGGLSVIFAGYHIFSTPVDSISGIGGIDAGASFGVYLATLAAVAVTYGGWRKMHE